MEIKDVSLGSTMPLSTGQVLNNRYRIVKLLGEGGFGAVYRAWDLNLKRAFALKENFDLSPKSARQFEREATFLADLHHPNLPRVIDCFMIPEQGQYLVMDFIEGQTLDEILVKVGTPLPEAQVIPWIEQVCDALTFLHNQNPPVIHRDIKPANIKITPEGKAVLVDFGIAKAYLGQQQTTLGARAITEGYSPPEQYGHGVTDGRSDVYALGATFYHMLTGQIPVESVRRHLDSSLIPPRDLNPSISPAVEAAVLQAMATDVNDRFQSAGAFKSAISSPVAVLPHAPIETQAYDAFEETLISHPPLQIPQPPEQIKQEGRSRKGMFIGAALVVIAFMCIMAVGLGALGGAFAFLKGTVTPTPSATLSLPTEAIIPTAVPTDEPTQAPTDTPYIAPPTYTSMPTDVPPTLTLTRTRTPTPESGEWKACTNTYVSRLHINDLAYVAHYPPLRNNVRSRPGLDESRVGLLEPGEEMKIIDGPACADHMVWWKISSLEKPLTGWTSEGDMENYWLVPLPAP